MLTRTKGETYVLLSSLGLFCVVKKESNPEGQAMSFKFLGDFIFGSRLKNLQILGAIWKIESEYEARIISD